MASPERSHFFTTFHNISQLEMLISSQQSLHNLLISPGTQAVTAAAFVACPVPATVQRISPYFTTLRWQKPGYAHMWVHTG